MAIHNAAASLTALPLAGASLPALSSMAWAQGLETVTVIVELVGRIFNDGADRIPAFHIANLFLILTPPSGGWWLEAYAKNLGDAAGINGEYLSGATSGLYTGVFYTDPRTYGLAVHASL